MVQDLNDKKIVSGDRFCGKVRYQGDGEPFGVGHCHCERCRKNTGAPVVTFAGFEKCQVTFSGGERQFYKPSPGVSRSFCGVCGTPLTWEGKSNFQERGEIVEFYISTLDDPEVFQLTNHIMVR